MIPSKLRKIGIDEGLSGRLLSDFIKFMTIRLPTESSEMYVKEWAGRFMDGKEWFASDPQSKAVLLKINKAFYEPLKEATKGPSWDYSVVDKLRMRSR